MTSTTRNLFDDLTERDDWAGAGYLGERVTCLESDDLDVRDPELVAAVDKLLLDQATRAGLTTDQLFEWANSRTGRKFADVVFGDVLFDRRPLEVPWRQALGWHLTPAHPTRCGNCDGAGESWNCSCTADDDWCECADQADTCPTCDGGGVVYVATEIDEPVFLEGD